jgi:hypothetical protein
MEARPSIRADLAAIAILVITALLALIQSYHRWLDPIIDTGRDLYISGAILDGARLYRDLRYQYPPLAPYVLAAVTALTGRGLDAFMAIGITQSLAVVVAIYTLLRRAAGTAAAFTASMLFVALCFCGASTWGCNFIFPYSYAATLGIACYLGYCTFLHRYLFAGRSSVTFAGAATLGLAAAWCKIEYSFAVLVTFSLLAIVHRIRLRHVLAIIAGAAATFGLAYAFFHDPRSGYDWLRDDIFSASLLGGESATRFYAQVAGTSNAAQGLVRAVAGCVVIAAIAGALGAIDRIVRRRPDARAGVMIAATLLMVLIGWMIPPTTPLFRAWTLLLPLGVLWSMASDRRSELLFFLLFALTAAARIPLNLTAEWYGFVLVLPTFVAMAYVLFGELPRRGAYAPATALLWLPLFVVIAGKGLWQQHERYSVKRWPIVSMRGTLFDHNSARAAVLNDLIAVVPTMHAKSLVVVPEGMTLNYLTGVPTPLSFHTFTPPETGAPSAESLLLRELDERRPQYFAVVTRDVSEYGSHGFGVDYDQRVLEHVRTHYVMRRVWPGRGFQAVLLERK